MDKFKITVKLNCKAKDVFTGWLNNNTHANFTGGAKAEMSPSEGGSFSAYDGYITGTNVEIFPHKRIIQKWRTKDFAYDDPDSTLELQITQKEDFTLVALTHSGLPDGEGDKYKKYWKENYFTFMKKHFGGD